MPWMGVLWEAAESGFSGDDPVVNMAAGVTSLSLQAAPVEADAEGKTRRGKRERKFRRGLGHLVSTTGFRKF